MTDAKKAGLLTLPGDEDLARMLGVPLSDRIRFRRTTLHEWPLSRVELAEPQAQGEVPGLPPMIVKTQFAAASVERAFYRFAEERGIGKGNGIRLPQLIGSGASPDGETDWLILSREPGEPENWSDRTDGEIRARVKKIGAAIENWDAAGEAPVFTDWRTHDRFAAALAEDYPLFRGIERFEALAHWIETDAAACWNAPVGLLHGDLKADNLLRAEDAAILLDWQRPMRAPLPLEEELSLLLEGRSGEVSPCRTLACLATAHWYAWAWRTCLPYPFVKNQALTYAARALAQIPGRI